MLVCYLLGLFINYMFMSPLRMRSRSLERIVVHVFVEFSYYIIIIVVFVLIPQNNNTFVVFVVIP